MKKFWNWVTNDAGERTLRLEGPIDSDDVWGDSVTPAWFRSELESGEGDITVWINSPGGSVFAAAEIYTMLRDYKGKVTVKIDAIAASAASVVAMSGDKVLMSPVAMLMLHDPATVAMGNTRDMQKAIETLDAVKESIVNAYHAKSGLSRNKISTLMSNETWLDAREAFKLGFCDEILFTAEEKPEEEEEEEPDKPDEDEPDEDEDDDEKKGVHLYSTHLMDQMILNRLGVTDEAQVKPPQQESPVDTEPPQPVIGMDGTTEDGSVPYPILEKQLEFLR
ncbi:MAG: Clp protease ClpP [Oscillospiraceae bacterium]|nr:Clp protease ClpP [Oscillospiraceae bacterium]